MQIRITAEGKRAMDLLKKEIYQTRGQRLGMGEILLEILSEVRPDIVKEAVEDVSGCEAEA